jgi:hypothetical protein
MTPENLIEGLNRDEVPVDDSGVLLLDQGATLACVEEREFLFEHFRPWRGDLPVAATSTTSVLPPLTEPRPMTVADMGLAIGMPLGVRPQLSGSHAMRSSRVIGLAPNHMLFITPPRQPREPLDLIYGEQVEVMAVSDLALSWCLCTVEAICSDPFRYVVLSAPGNIRRLRKRGTVRAQVRLPVRHGRSSTADSQYDGIGLAQDISASGMSLMTRGSLGSVGDRFRIAFRIKTGDLDICLRPVAIIRNVRDGMAVQGCTIHGLEFEGLEASEQIALKAFVLERAHLSSSRDQSPQDGLSQ